LRTYWLNFHLAYRCRHSLACCSSGWPIPIERDRAAAVDQQIAAGQVHPLSTPWLRPAPGAPEEMAGTLALGPGDLCVFLGADGGQPKADGRPFDRLRVVPSVVEGRNLKAVGSCGIYATRPLSCVHFPYVCLIDQRGVRVTLSHYCPTAGSLLFDHTGPIEIVEGPPPIPEMEIPEGLDAREALPPLASPERLMTFDEFSSWEHEAVLQIGARRARGARRAKGADWRLFERVRCSVPPPLSWPAAPDSIERFWSELVEPVWETFTPVVDRYLAARLFASWAAYLGDGTEAILREVEIASAVLRVEATRQCRRAARLLDATLLKDAIGQSDLLLMHYVDRTALCQSRMGDSQGDREAGLDLPLTP
jgi:Fe-S-cluster containining protein